MITRKSDAIHFQSKRSLAARGIESGSMCVEGTTINWVRGVIHAQYVGLVRGGVRIKVGARTDVRMRWTRREERGFIVGQPVVAMMPAEAVRLEKGLFRRSKQRWNRWVGRIVLIERMEAGVLYTVKLHGGGVDPQKPWACPRSRRAD